MNRKNGRRSRGPPGADQVKVNSEEVLVRPDLVTPDPGLTAISSDAVLAYADEVVIASEAVIIR